MTAESMLNAIQSNLAKLVHEKCDAMERGDAAAVAACERGINATRKMYDGAFAKLIELWLIERVK